MQHFQDLLDLLIECSKIDPTKPSKDIKNLNFPILNMNDIQNICLSSTEIFKNEQSLLKISSPCIIVGDIHGQILDLFRIINDFGLPITRKYLFLGDLIDRGEFSIETVLIVLLMKIIWPNNVFLIRGNHEFRFLSSQGGFLDQIIDLYYGDELYEYFMNTFSYIPFSCLIDGTILCVHGGIGPSLKTISQLESIPRPILNYCNEIVDSLIWSDPTNEILFYEQSTRGTGFLYGIIALTDFLKSNNLTKLIRGHECINEGCKIMFNEQLYTVFSASNYCNIIQNQSAVLEIINKDQFKIISYNPTICLRRSEVSFVPIEKNKKKEINTSKSFYTLLPMLHKENNSVKYTPSKTIQFPSNLQHLVRKSSSIRNLSVM